MQPAIVYCSSRAGYLREVAALLGGGVALRATLFDSYQIPQCPRKLDKVADEFVEAADHRDRIDRRR